MLRAPRQLIQKALCRMIEFVSFSLSLITYRLIVMRPQPVSTWLPSQDSFSPLSVSVSVSLPVYLSSLAYYTVHYETISSPGPLLLFPSHETDDDGRTRVFFLDDDDDGSGI